MRTILGEDAHGNLIGVERDPGCSSVDPKLNANLTETPALAVQSLDFGALLLPLRCGLWGRQLADWGGRVGSWCGISVGLRYLPGGRPQDETLAIQEPHAHIANIANQVKPIGDLLRLGCASGSAVAIHISTIAANDFNRRIALEPGSDRFSIPIRQQIEGAVGIKIDNDRAVTLAFADGPIINADPFWRDDHRWFKGTNQAEHGIGTGAEVEDVRHA